MKTAVLAAKDVVERDEALKVYQKLALARLVEERIREEYPKDQINTAVHLGIGQEAIPVGVCHCLPPGSTVFGTYRNHAMFLTMTDDTDGFFAELYGKSTGVARGRGGSMHLFAPEQGVMVTSAVVGTPIPAAVGAALANAYRQSQNVVAVFFGDGAIEEGVFWESLNFACLRRLRILFVCEDNGLAIHTPTAERQGFQSIEKVLEGFDCDVVHGDGADLQEVMTVTSRVLQQMAREPKPAFLHLKYFRFLEHVGPGDDFHVGYRRKPSSEELERLDPLKRFEQVLCQNGCSADELHAIKGLLAQRIDRSIQAAQQAPFPSPAELTSGVLADTNAPRRDAVASGSPHRPTAKTTMTFQEALNRALVREMEADPTVFVFGLDVPDHKRIYGSTKGLVEQFGPRRCFGTPLSEEAMTGAALGAAIAGLRPVHVHIRVDFMLLGMNQIINMISNLHYVSAGKLRIPLVIRAMIGRGWGQSAQHSKSLHSIFAHFPGLKVVLPTTPQDAYSLLRAAIRDDNPVIFLEHRWLYDIAGEVDEEQVDLLGQAHILRPGKDVTIVGTCWMNVEALKAAGVLAKRGVELEVIDVRTVSPLDEEPIVASVKKTGRCVVVDHDWSFCGVGAELAALVSHRCFGTLRKPVERLGYAHAPCPMTRPLENAFYPSAVDIIRLVERMLGLESADLSGESFYSYEQRFKGPF